MLARSIIQDISFVDGKIADDVSHFDLLLTDIRELVLPGHHLTDPDSFQVEATSDMRHKTSRMMEQFLDGMLDEYLNLFRLLCQNRARIRRHSTQCIAIIDALETDLAQKYDAELQALTLDERHDTVFGQKQLLQPLTMWTRSCKLKVMDLHDIGMVQGCHEPGLAHEVRNKIGIVLQFCAQQFDRYIALELGVTGLPDLAHGTLSKSF